MPFIPDWHGIIEFLADTLSLNSLYLHPCKTWGLRTAGSVVPVPNNCAGGDVVSNNGWQITQATQIMHHTPKELMIEMTSAYIVIKNVFCKGVYKKFSAHQQ